MNEISKEQLEEENALLNDAFKDKDKRVAELEREREINETILDRCSEGTHYLRTKVKELEERIAKLKEDEKQLLILSQSRLDKIKELEQELETKCSYVENEINKTLVKESGKREEQLVMRILKLETRVEKEKEQTKHLIEYVHERDLKIKELEQGDEGL